jgi:hypothetical protein
MTRTPSPPGRGGSPRGASLLLLVGIVTACDDDPTAPDVGDFPTGTYAVTFDEDEADDPAIVGTWTTTWDPEGGLLVTFEGSAFVEGSFTVDGDRVTITDTAGPGACPGPGVYSWSFDDPELTLTEVSDDCEGRPSVLTTKPWEAE